MKSKMRTPMLGLLVGLLYLVPAALAADVQWVRPQALSPARAFTAEALQKLDPRLVVVLSVPERNMDRLKSFASMIPMLGETADALRYPVLVKSGLSDAELAALGAEPNSRAGDVVTAIVEERDLPALAAEGSVQAIEAAYWLAPALDVSVPEIRANLVQTGNPGYTGDGVLYGIIDSGVDLTHEDFKDASGSRVEFFWDQGGQGSAPAGFNYGVEYTRQQINNGQFGNFQDQVGHGSHCAGISVGDGSASGGQYKGVAPEAKLIVCRNTGCDMFCYGGGNPMYEQQGGNTTVGAIDALTWMAQKRQALGNKPLVINQSQGTMLGSHDGNTLFEQAYNTKIQQNNLILCVAAGNDEDSNWHGQVDVNAGGQGDFTLQASASQGPVGYIWFECWYKQGDQFKLQVFPPSGQGFEVPASTNGQVLQANLSEGDIAVVFGTTSHASNQQGYFMCQIFDSGQNQPIVAGNYGVRVVADNNLPAGGLVDLYCERNQAWLQVASPNLDAIVGMPGTCTNVITVASYATKREWDAASGHITDQSVTVGDISAFSSWGPRRDGAQKPDISAPGQWIASVFAAGSQQPDYAPLPGNKYTMEQGTSMATPHVAGTIALMLEKKADLTLSQVKDILKSTARKDNFTGASEWTKKFGWGKLDAKAAVDAVGGGGGGDCATRAGDANGDNTVNVLDAVTTVNKILGQNPSGFQQACADVNHDSIVNVLDVVSIVNIIIGPPRPASDDAVLPPLAWAETKGSGTWSLTIDAGDLAGLEMTYVLPRGAVTAGAPRLAGAAGSVRVHDVEQEGQHHLIAWAPDGALARAGGDLTLEIPYTNLWTPRVASDLEVTSITLADAAGRARALAAEPGLEPGDGAQGPLETYLAAAVPNPMQRLTRIAYELPSSGRVEMVLYDAEGRRLRSLWSGWQGAGPHSMNWDGRDDRGVEVPGGVYFVRLTTPGREDSRKILVMR